MTKMREEKESKDKEERRRGEGRNIPLNTERRELVIKQLGLRVWKSEY